MNHYCEGFSIVCLEADLHLRCQVEKKKTSTVRNGKTAVVKFREALFSFFLYNVTFNIECAWNVVGTLSMVGTLEVFSARIHQHRFTAQ